MAKGDDKTLVASSFLWRFFERIGAQVVSFLVSTILARLLLPEDYGTIALVNIFITLANVFVTSGFGNALVQKKNADDTDFSSVFYFNLGLSLVLYGIVFFCAPLIASVYEEPQLIPVCRVMGLRLIIASVNTIQHAYVSRHMLFRRFFWSTLGGTVLSGVVGIAMAYCGFGIWALVAQYMVNVTTDTLVLFITVKWRPKLLFSKEKLKGLLSYGWKLLASELVNTGYLELRSFIIGIQYSSADLAFYNRGQSFPKLFVVNVNSAIQSTLFPVLSKAQDDLVRLKAMARRAIRTSSYIVLPLTIGLALVAKPLISLLLTDRWLECVPFLQMYCISYGLMPVQTANLQMIKAVGRTDIYLKLEIVKKITGTLLLLAAMPFGVHAIAASAVTVSVLSILVNTMANKKLLNYTLGQQLRDLFNAFLPLLIMSAAVYAVGLLALPDILLLGIQVAVGGVTYVAASWVLKNESFIYLLNFAKSFLHKKKKVKE